MHISVPQQVNVPQGLLAVHAHGSRQRIVVGVHLRGAVDGVC